MRQLVLRVGEEDEEDDDEEDADDEFEFSFWSAIVDFELKPTFGRKQLRVPTVADAHCHSAKVKGEQSDDGVHRANEFRQACESR